MCAIAGVINLNLEEETKQKMLSSMHRRGPDSTGVYQNGLCALLHARLAIIDPEGGGQPMKCCWAGETYVLIYNGELYNTEEIRSELIKKGHHFTGHSDTEVVLHAYMISSISPISEISFSYSSSESTSINSSESRIFNPKISNTKSFSK